MTFRIFVFYFFHKTDHSSQAFGVFGFLFVQSKGIESHIRELWSLQMVSICVLHSLLETNYRLRLTICSGYRIRNALY